MAVEQFNVGVVDCRIAARTGVATYGAVHDVVAIGSFGITFNVASDELMGDGGVVDIFSRIIKAELRFSFGFRSMAVWSILTGQSISSASSYDQIAVDSEKLPYFGITFVTEHSDGSGNTVFFAPKCKVMSDVEFSAEQTQYITNEITATAVRENGTYKVVTKRQANYLQSVDTMPPWS